MQVCQERVDKPEILADLHQKRSGLRKGESALPPKFARFDLYLCGSSGNALACFHSAGSHHFNRFLVGNNNGCFNG